MTSQATTTVQSIMKQWSMLHAHTLKFIHEKFENPVKYNEVYALLRDIQDIEATPPVVN